jgi:hypothetical protein
VANKQEPYTERDFSELSRKLKSLSKDLTPKESAFLTDVVENTRKAIAGGEVQGFGGPYDAQAYKPEAKGGTESAMIDPTIKVVVKGTFVTQK